MKIRKILSLIMIILLCSTGLIFGCQKTPLEINILNEKDKEISQIFLSLPVNNLNTEDEIQDDEETPDEENTEENGDEKIIDDETEEDIDIYNCETSQIIYISSNIENTIFSSGIDCYAKENGIVKIEDLGKNEKGYKFKITALYPKNVLLTFETKDKKTKANLLVNINQDIEKITANNDSENYLLLGKTTQIDTSVVYCSPSTTTNKNIAFELQYNYEGISLNDNEITVDDRVTLNGVEVNKISLQAYHKDKYNATEETEENLNYIVKNIEFDLIRPIDNLVALSGQASVSELTFASNLSIDDLSVKTISIKALNGDKYIITTEGGETSDNSYEIDESYEILWRLENPTEDIVSIEKDNFNNLTITQNFRSGENVLIIWARNKIQQSYVTKEIRINIHVLTYPTFISVNGTRNPEEIILYDDGSSYNLEVTVGSNASYNTQYKISEDNTLYTSSINVKFENGLDVFAGTPINSGTKLVLSCKDRNLSANTEENYQIILEACGCAEKSKVRVTLNIRIVQSVSINDIQILSGVTDSTQYTISKLNDFGELNELTLKVKTKTSSYVPKFTVHIEDEKVVNLKSLNLTKETERTLTLVAVEKGTTVVTLNFDNGLSKEIDIVVYTEINGFTINIDTINSKNNLGEIIYSNYEFDLTDSDKNNDLSALDGKSIILSSFALKINKSANFLFSAYDINGNIIDNSAIKTITYTYTTDCFTIDNNDNFIFGLKETSEEVSVTVKVVGFNDKELEQTFKVSVYIPLESINVLATYTTLDGEVQSDSYVNLYTQNDLGYYDQKLSTAKIKVTLNPSNATKVSYNNILVQTNFVTELTKTDKVTKNNTSYNYTFTAENLSHIENTVGTITFTIQEYNIVYTQKVTVRITKTIAPTKVLVDNVEQVETEEYLYFNLNYDEPVSINPIIYPYNSYNLKYDYLLINKTVDADPISFENGLVSPINAGECDLILIPLACYINEADYNDSAVKKIHIFVADGVLVPYQMDSKDDLLKLMSPDVVVKNNSDEEELYISRFTKKYILTSDINMQNESVLPIGIYRVQNSNQSVTYKVIEFTGEINGEFRIGSVTKSYSITGLYFNLQEQKNFNVENSDGEVYSYVGFVAINNGTIKNLSIQYTNITSVFSEYKTPRLNDSEKVFNFFGGVSSINKKEIKNCNVVITNSSLTTYYVKNNIGFISGENDGNISNSFAKGNLTIVDGAKSLDTSVDIKLEINAGGLVGYNKGSLSGEFDITTNKQDIQIFNKDIINSNVNISLVINNNPDNINTTSSVGELVGRNEGKISQLSSYGKVIAPNFDNVGGCVGINCSGEIEKLFTSSIIYGHSCVGGLIGLNLSEDKILNNSIMLLDDDIFVIVDNVTLKTKIVGKTFVAGLIGKSNKLEGESAIDSFTSLCENGKIEKNFVKSYVTLESGYADILCLESDFGGLCSNDVTYSFSNLIPECKLGSNFANVSIYNLGNQFTTTGSVAGVGIYAPISLSVQINSSTLFEDNLYSYNKFIKVDGENIIIYLYDTNTDEAKYNYYLHNYIFSIVGNYETSVDDEQKLSLYKIESLNQDILIVDDYGNFRVLAEGIAQIRISSLLNKNAYAILNIKIISCIDDFSFYADSLCQEKITNYIYAEIDISKNLYLYESIKQDDVYIQYSILSDNNILLVNSFDATGLTTKYFSTLYSQIIKPTSMGTVTINAKLFVKINGNYYELPHNAQINVIVKAGLKNVYSNIENANIVMNAGLDLQFVVETDLISTTNVKVEQILNGDSTQEYLKLTLDKDVESDRINYNYKIFINKEKLNDCVNQTIYFKIYFFDSFVSLDMIKGNEEEYQKYIKIIPIYVQEFGLINADLTYFADGEVIKDANGNSIINTNELESEYIKIGKLGILKINIYPIENIEGRTLTLTYTNSDNLNLNFAQVRKTAQGYENLNNIKLINKGIELNIDEENIDEGYLYVKLLTDSPIKEGSKFVLRLNISDYSYYFEKTLTSQLTSNLEISYNNAILNKEGKLEGVYAKGVQNQIISLTISKLNEYPYKFNIKTYNADGTNSSSVAQITLNNRTNLGSEVVKYDFMLDGTLNVGEIVEIEFYVDKTVNGKTERYRSILLKLNIVEFVVNGYEIQYVEDGYLTMPYGATYPLKVILNTTNGGSAEVLNAISAIEEEISKDNVWYFNNELISVNSTYDQYINSVNLNGFIGLNSNKEIKSSKFANRFTISYSLGKVGYFIEDSTSDTKIFINSDNKYSQRFAKNFGVDFFLLTDVNNPMPIYTQTEFESMNDGGNYILMNDLTLINYTPKNATINSLDGNAYTITIESLNIDLSAENTTYNFGLFNEISETTLIKNLNVALNLKENNVNNIYLYTNGYSSLSFTNITALSFGVLAGVNRGLIYNCEIKEFKYGYEVSELNIIFDGQNVYAGGLVGQNAGIITNSRSLIKLRFNKGFVASFAGINTGTISSSYAKQVKITNFGEDEATSAVGGFVYDNSGEILYSFVEGEENNVVAGIHMGKNDDYCLIAPISMGGFVYNNSGVIEDCYANLTLTSQGHSGGFVYSNSGKIIRCYSATINEAKNNDAHAPFIAQFINGPKVDTTLFENCYYLNNGKNDQSVINDAYITSLTLEEFEDSFYLTNFIFSDENSVWCYENKMSLPTLCEANNIAISSRQLASMVVSSDGTVNYNYTYNMQSNNETYYMGHQKNPIIISNEEEFISYFTTRASVNNYYYRIINNIDFDEYSNLPTTNTVFSGVLDGNGLEISNLRISANSGYISDYDSFGLFSVIKKSSSSTLTPVVKNLTISPSEVYANNIMRVGTLAGYVEDANIYNIKVDASGVIVQGKNLVGGVIGEAKGNSNIVNIESNVSVNANYSKLDFNGRYIYSSKNARNNYNSYVSYSGSIIGALDVNQTEDGNERVRNVKVYSGVKAIGEFVGLAFGVIGEDSGIDDVKVYANANGYVNATYAGGLVVGENRGYISRVETIKASDDELVLFKNKTHFIGGIVGFNNNGSIVNSIARLDVVSENANTNVAGGVVGICVGGSISSVYTDNEVFANSVVGGIIGISARREMLANINDYNSKLNTIITNINNTDYMSNDAIFDDYIKSNNIVYIANCVVNNQITSLSRCYEYLKSSTKFIGAIIGAAHNTSQTEENTISFATKNSYICVNNYYRSFTYTDGEDVYNLQDFGALNCENIIDFPSETQNDGFSITKNMGSDDILPEEKCATSYDGNVGLSMFAKWSSSIFTFGTSSVVEFKNINNINSKGLVGEGTSENPYLVSSTYGVKQLANLVNAGNREVTVSLIDNIEFTGKEFVSIGTNTSSFNGIFKGNGYYINGLTYTNKNEYYNQSTFGLFGTIGKNARVTDLNVVANFIINYGSNIQYTGIIAGVNNGYIGNCNVYGGIVAILQYIVAPTSSQSGLANATSYIGGIAGANMGQGDAIVASTNNAIMYIAVFDVENPSEEVINDNQKVDIFAGYIVGANANTAIVNRCVNKRTKNLLINQGAKGDNGSESDKIYTLIVLNKTSDDCVNHVGYIAGYCDASATVYETESEYDTIYSLAERTIKYKGQQ
ncbi:MAG: hypothetical protein ACI4T1_04800 [Christensenellales bacterium]